MQEIGKCTEEHQAIVRKWLEERKLDEVFTPHPAWKTRTLLSIWGQQMLA